MRVSIDKTGYDDLAGGVDRALCQKIFRHGRTLSDRHDLVPFNRNRTVFNKPPILVHRHNRPANDQEINADGRSRSSTNRRRSSNG